MDTQPLRQFISQEKPFEQATEGFWEYVTSWHDEDPHEFFNAFQTTDLSTIIVINEKISLVINYRFDEIIQYVQTTLRINAEGRSIGRYHFLQTLDGNEIDDGIDYE